jgi:hypothetical protein
MQSSLLPRPDKVRLILDTRLPSCACTRRYLLAGSGDDILIGSTTSFDSNTAALLAIGAEWFSADAYLTRVND